MFRMSRLTCGRLAATDARAVSATRVPPSRRTAMTLNRAWLLLAACLMTPITTASANVVTDWDEKAVAFIQPRMVPPVAYRAMAIMHIAMFDAVNSIEPVYRPYYAQLPATRETSKEAAA